MATTGLLVTAELATSTITTTAIATSVDASPLLTALIGLGVSIVTMVGGELVKFLVAFFKKKTKDLNGDAEDEAEKDDKKEGK